jgi:FkbM family methyltransferase
VRARSKSLLHRLGLDVGRTRADDVHVRRGRLLRHKGTDLVLDVGANGGHYGTYLRRFSGYPGRLVSFEPVSSAYRELEACAHDDPLWDTRNIALGDRDGELAINVASATVLSSFLLPRADAPIDSAESSRELVEMRRLDELFPTIREMAESVWLKLDVQGLELDVLRGSEQALPEVQVIECEMPLEGLYEGQPSFMDLAQALDDRGYRPVGVEPNASDARTGRVLDADFLFERR